jgi:hypothetical protein
LNIQDDHAASSGGIGIALLHASWPGFVPAINVFTAEML